MNKSFFNNSERTERRIFNLNFFDYKRVNSIEGKRVKRIKQMARGEAYRSGRVGPPIGRNG